jgi:hypothetical protein
MACSFCKFLPFQASSIEDSIDIEKLTFPQKVQQCLSLLKQVDNRLIGVKAYKLISLSMCNTATQNVKLKEGPDSWGLKTPS